MAFSMKKNILLINSAGKPASQSKIVNQLVVKIIPTSIGILAGCLMDRKVVASVRIVDEQVEFIEDNDAKEIVLLIEKPRVSGQAC